jgi:alpha-L-rhamnosidase
MRVSFFSGLSMLLLFIAPHASAQGVILDKPVALQCDSLHTPIGDDSKRPLLSWKLQDGRQGANLTAYRLMVSQDPGFAKGNADVWDSGRIDSDRSVDVPYAGPDLSPGTHYYYWRE